MLLLLPRRDFLPVHETKDSYLQVLRLGIGTPSTLSSKRIVGTSLDFFSINMDFLFHAWMWLRKKNSARKIDLIHAHSDGGFGYSLRNGLYLSRWIKKPLIISFHEKIGTNKGDMPPRVKLFKKYFGIAKKIIVHRKQNLRYFRQWGYGDKAVFIPIPIDVQRFQRSDDVRISQRNVFRVLYLGRLDERRGFTTLTKAFSLLHNSHKNVELHIVGYGGLLSQLEKLKANNAELSKAILFHGKQLDVRKYLWRSDIFVSLNISDNYPSLALREAMAAGLAPIVTDVGETRNLICDGINGMLIPPSDPMAVSNAIITLIEDEKLRMKLSANAKVSSQNFDIRKLVNNFIKIYDEAACE